MRTTTDGGTGRSSRRRSNGKRGKRRVREKPPRYSKRRKRHSSGSAMKNESISGPGEPLASMAPKGTERKQPWADRRLASQPTHPLAHSVRERIRSFTTDCSFGADRQSVRRPGRRLLRPRPEGGSNPAERCAAALPRGWLSSPGASRRPQL